MCAKGMIARKKSASICRDSNQQLFVCKSGALPSEHCLLWFSVAQVFSTPSPSTQANGSMCELTITDLE